MTAPIAPIQHGSLVTDTPRVPAQGAERYEGVAREFEALWIRQMLEAAHFGAKGGGFGAMAADALAQGIARNGGLGLASRLADALGHTLMESTQSSSFREADRSLETADVSTR